MHIEFSRRTWIYLIIGILILRIVETITPNPKYATVFYRYGLDEEKKNKLTNAIKFYERAIRANPALAEPYYQLGLINKNWGQKSKLIEYFLIATNLKNDFDKAYDDLGLIFLEYGYYNRALVAFAHAIFVNPLPIYYYHKALCHMALGQEDEVTSILTIYLNDLSLVEQLKQKIKEKGW